MNTTGNDIIPALSDINIRNTLMPGDIGSIIAMHGSLYGREYNYGVAFETYVAKGLLEFYENYNPQNERVWICEHNNNFAGSLLLANRGNAAQLRYFILAPPYRGIGLGKKLMTLYMEFLKQCSYTSSYLWTTHELSAAASLYKKHGFTLTEEIESSAFGKPLREQKYVLTNVPA